MIFCCWFIHDLFLLQKHFFKIGHSSEQKVHGTTHAAQEHQAICWDHHASFTMHGDMTRISQSRQCPAQVNNTI